MTTHPSEPFPPYPSVEERLAFVEAHRGNSTKLNTEPTEAMLADVEGQQLVQAIHDRKLGKGRTTSADCTCPRSSNGYRRGINPTCPWDGLQTTGFTVAPA